MGMPLSICQGRVGVTETLSIVMVNLVTSEECISFLYTYCPHPNGP